MKNRIALAAFMLVSLQAAAADVEVKDAWARATVPGQKASGAFMSVTSAKGATLLGASSPVAKTVEIHEMKTEGDVMKMRAVHRIELPAGKTVNLTGDYHIMFIDLNKELKAGDKVPLTLKVEQKGKQEKVKVEAEVRALDAAKPGDDHQHHH
ncbi:MAG TPA: copper chaperone PCu(A)C [Rhodocyclaceae bacterium]|nr:copper chaperone PCu(A)C [Rhodocyclaceae bacterium]